MTTLSNVLTERPSHQDATEITPVRRLYWSVRRELWENRSIYLAPPAVAAVFLIGFLISLVWLPGEMRNAMTLTPMERQAAVEQPYLIAAVMLMFIGLLVAVFYCLDALYGERRDRSILFWKSMPVSDLETILSKASIPILVIPMVTFVITVATHLTMLLLSSAVLAANGMSAEIVWTHVPILKTAWINFVHLVGYHGIWYAPFYGWMLMVSAWARRAPLLWAVLPPVAVGVVEKIALGTSHFARMLQYRFMGSPDAATTGNGLSMDMLASGPEEHLLTGPGLWLGLAVTAIFLFASVRLHRSRGPI